MVEGGSDALLFRFCFEDIAGQADWSVIFGKGSAKIPGSWQRGSEPILLLTW